jgi:hypothetical protein
VFSNLSCLANLPDRVVLLLLLLLSKPILWSSCRCSGKLFSLFSVGSFLFKIIHDSAAAKTSLAPSSSSSRRQMSQTLGFRPQQFDIGNKCHSSGAIRPGQPGRQQAKQKTVLFAAKSYEIAPPEGPRILGRAYCGPDYNWAKQKRTTN